ncbi:DUF3313 domain-containing protein [Shimwellia blattae]|uniref:Putative lipoprotein n=1 Tax=Shimwellia blattae (strain ATCC 29907 / DSM 4481 / JCM 1650 / NBRC 105725 / CDC 9005-74) TaxID=630626 RepID=I2B443_SHIBC|nr:DUF3313 domain-containing protein [Shimwellia blattae]AFJ45297.1 putative lipoprotein [Shimwellia blattae DSM 4481 = NBRC 105725]GAB80590.1 hypothetical protein YdcL [Shimwellia blattae DSM 4481 = NBRC 105725]VDY62778.1 Protein of uncharacterised function (DUF3313) [Shimwellia blattae]VEC19615.1 Protein of uncharacterised function (DUF3313) [Shimwellia blattae]
MNLNSTAKLLCALVTAGVMLSGCSSSRTEKQQYSGFLKDYSGLTEAVSASGQPVLRWVDPTVNFANYDKLIYNPVTYYPTPRPGPQVSQETLNQVRNYADQKLKSSLQSRFTLTTKPGPKTLIIRSAITAVNTSNESMQFYEVLPVTMVLAAGQVVTGYRTQDTHLYFEAEAVDSVTGKVLIKVLRKGNGKQLSNSQQAVTMETLKGVIDSLATDARLFENGIK